MPDIESELLAARRLLFYQHPCDGKYGDDGEMQCAACGIDFRRDSMAEINAKLIRKALSLPDVRVFLRGLR